MKTTWREKMKEIEKIEREQLGPEGEMTEEEKLSWMEPQGNNQKVSVGLGTMIMGRILFGKFSK